MKNLNQLKETYLMELTRQGYAEGTINNRRIYLEEFVSFLNKIRKQIVKQTLYQYQIQLSKASISSMSRYDKLSILHCFLSWLYRKDHILVDLSSAIEFPKRVSYLPKRILTESEVKYILSLPDVRSSKGIRDRALLELLYSTGIRRSELVALNLYDLNTDEGMLRVVGKGNKERIVPIGKSAIEWTLRYIEKVRWPYSLKESALFLGLSQRQRLTPKILNLIIREYAAISHIRKVITPHTFRHTCATHLLKHGADIRYVQELLGHASPETTQIYTRVIIKDLKKVYKMTHPRAIKK